MDLRDERGGRGVERGQEDRDVIGERLDHVAGGAEGVRAMVEIPERKSELHDGADLVQPELEGGHHPEVATAASNGPEEIRVVIG